jgi:hypothetical protein
MKHILTGYSEVVKWRIRHFRIGESSGNRTPLPVNFGDSPGYPDHDPCVINVKFYLSLVDLFLPHIPITQATTPPRKSNISNDVTIPKNVMIIFLRCPDHWTHLQDRHFRDRHLQKDMPQQRVRCNVGR